MIIDLDPKHRITSNPRCWQIEKEQIIKGVATWSPFAYFGTLASALSGAAQREIRMSPAHGVKEALEAVEAITDKYGKLFDEVKL